jgi:hypothetical protein
MTFNVAFINDFGRQSFVHVHEDALLAVLTSLFKAGYQLLSVLPS